MDGRIIGVALRNLEAGQVCILGKDIATSGACKVSIANQLKEGSMEANSRGLFGIRVVDLETDKVVHAEEVVAEGEQDALFESDVKEALKKLGLKKEDVHIIVKEFGSVPQKPRPKTVRFVGQLGKTILGRETEK